MSVRSTKRKSSSKKRSRRSSSKKRSRRSSSKKGTRRLSREAYIKKYIGAPVPAYKSKKMYELRDIKPTRFADIKRIVDKKTGDTVRYFVNGRYHAAKTKGDRARRSKSQSWEKKIFKLF